MVTEPEKKSVLPAPSAFGVVTDDEASDSDPFAITSSDEETKSQKPRSRPRPRRSRFPHKAGHFWKNQWIDVMGLGNGDLWNRYVQFGRFPEFLTIWSQLFHDEGHTYSGDSDLAMAVAHELHATYFRLQVFESEFNLKLPSGHDEIPDDIVYLENLQVYRLIHLPTDVVFQVALLRIMEHGGLISPRFLLLQPSTPLEQVLRETMELPEDQKLILDPPVELPKIYPTEREEPGEDYLETVLEKLGEIKWPHAFPELGAKIRSQLGK